MPYPPHHITNETKNVPVRPVGVFGVRAQPALAVVADGLPGGRRRRRYVGSDLRGFALPSLIFAAAAALVVCLSAWVGLTFALFCLFF
jgi:hypothetical protein